MSQFLFEAPLLSDSEEAEKDLLELCSKTRETLRGYPAEKALIKARPWTTVCFRLPTHLVLALDRIAEDADVSRSLLLRHIATEFEGAVREEGIRFYGSLFRADTLEERRQRYIR